MKKIAIIPARYAATRFPGKLMQLLGDKTIIRYTYEAVVATKIFDEVIVATDSEIIFNEIVSHSGKAIMSKRTHESGSDRIAEAAEEMSARSGTDGDLDIIVDVQGDEPFIKKEPLEKLVKLFDDPSVNMASLMRQIQDPNEIVDPNCVKVIVDKNSNALYFSRSVIPYPRNNEISITYFGHIGVYAFRKKALLEFTKLPMTPLESAEKIECLRYLEHGGFIRMAEVDHMGIGIDTPADLKKATSLL